MTSDYSTTEDQRVLYDNRGEEIKIFFFANEPVFFVLNAR